MGLTTLPMPVSLFDYSKAHLTNLSLDFSIENSELTPAPACLLPTYVCNLTTHRHIPILSCRLVNTPTHLDDRLARFTVSPDRAADDDTRGVQPWQVRLMGSRGGSLAAQMGHRHMSVHHSDSDDVLSGDSPPPTGGLALGHSHSHGSHAATTGCNTGFLMQLVGFDRFTSGKAANDLTRTGHATNPFNVGVVGNCPA